MNSRPKILIFGSNGMLGHKVWLTLSESFDVTACLRTRLDAAVLTGHHLSAEQQLVEPSFDDPTSLSKIFAGSEPDIVINCTGHVSQPKTDGDIIKALTINSIFPHNLAEACGKHGSRLIHISSDGVFSGQKGAYSENDRPDALDPYGMSKTLGEIKEGGLNVRTSIIGLQLNRKGGVGGLLEWLIASKGKQISGYANYYFSGITTNALAVILRKIIESNQELNGTVHIGATRISKYDLLCRLNAALKLDCKIIKEERATPDYEGTIDRSLDSSRFYSQSLVEMPDWEQMLESLHLDRCLYEKINNP